MQQLRQSRSVSRSKLRNWRTFSENHHQKILSPRNQLISSRRGSLHLKPLRRPGRNKVIWEIFLINIYYSTNMLFWKNKKRKPKVRRNKALPEQIGNNEKYEKGKA